jgi:hypothetical protein
MLPKIPSAGRIYRAPALEPGQNARAETFPDRYDLANIHRRERSQM